MKKFLPLVLIAVLLVARPLTIIAQQGKPVLNHIAVYVKDLKTSTDFYINIVSLDTIPEPFHDGKHTWFSVSENSHLHLIQGAKAITSHDKNTHLCFSVPSVESVIERLDKNGIRYENWAGQEKAVTTRVDGIKQIYFNDPDGYWIEINNDYPKKAK
jgi:lactoylglutathione lyase